MKQLLTLMVFLSILFTVTGASAQKIGLAFGEYGNRWVIDGRSELVPNPDLGDSPSAIVYVIAYEITELFGYEYNLASSDGTSVMTHPITYPSSSANFGSLPGDVRVGTGVCFRQLDPEAGPEPTHIRLTKTRFSWLTPPVLDVLYCLNASTASGILSGAIAPQYTECVPIPTPLPFGVVNQLSTCIPPGCAGIIFEWESDGVTPTHCQRLPAQLQSWGALKAAY